MLGELVAQSWANITRHRTRSALTMLGIVWGIVAVTVLIAYGTGFRAILTHAFNAFGKSAVVAWPGQTSEQAGGERAGRKVRFEREWLDGVTCEPGEVVLLENVRFNKGEKKNKDELAQKMAALCDVYVMDAFATAHRAEASTHGVGRFAPIACAGWMPGPCHSMIGAAISARNSRSSAR